MILEINPKSVLHQHYKSRKAERTEQPDSTTWDHQDSLRKSIEGCLHTNLSTSIEDSDEEAPFLSPDTDSDSDPEQTFYRNWRYLPPLSEDAVAIMDAILANPATAEKLARVGPDKEDFVEGLRDRNVFLDESEDPRIDYIRNLGSEEVVSETEEQKNVHEPLWYQDQAKCNYGSSNEALYQRTIMMSMIARHCLIYERKLLDFSVEETWTCPPMPTRAYNDNGSFLTQPKPDLAVCFRRQALIPDATWYGLPKATRRLACYENIGETGGERIFHFCAIEAKKGRTAITDDIGKRQSLNNASQALHNMFEFFREAGPHCEEAFFSSVRFFSVVSSTEGLSIRIHRATREPADGSGRGWIVEPSHGEAGYPLRFEFQTFATIEKRNDFTRQEVLQTFQKILLGYGEKELDIGTKKLETDAGRNHRSIRHRHVNHHDAWCHSDTERGPNFNPEAITKGYWGTIKYSDINTERDINTEQNVNTRATTDAY